MPMQHHRRAIRRAPPRRPLDPPGVCQARRVRCPMFRAPCRYLLLDFAPDQFAQFVFQMTEIPMGFVSALIVQHQRKARLLGACSVSASIRSFNRSYNFTSCVTSLRAVMVFSHQAARGRCLADNPHKCSSRLDDLCASGPFACGPKWPIAHRARHGDQVGKYWIDVIATLNAHDDCASAYRYSVQFAWRRLAHRTLRTVRSD